MFSTKASMLLLATFLAVSANQPAPPRLVLTFFGSPTCEECLEIKNTLLKPLEAQHESTLKIHFKNIEDEKDFTLLSAMEKGYKFRRPLPRNFSFPTPCF